MGVSPRASSGTPSRWFACGGCSRTGHQQSTPFFFELVGHVVLHILGTGGMKVMSMVALVPHAVCDEAVKPMLMSRLTENNLKSCTRSFHAARRASSLHRVR